MFYMHLTQPCKAKCLILQVRKLRLRTRFGFRGVGFCKEFCQTFIGLPKNPGKLLGREDVYLAVGGFTGVNL